MSVKVQYVVYRLKKLLTNKQFFFRISVHSSEQCLAVAYL